LYCSANACSIIAIRRVDDAVGPYRERRESWELPCLRVLAEILRKCTWKGQREFRHNSSWITAFGIQLLRSFISQGKPLHKLKSCSEAYITVLPNRKLFFGMQQNGPATKPFGYSADSMEAFPRQIQIWKRGNALRILVCLFPIANALNPLFAASP
jgi:hypothetical protein